MRWTAPTPPTCTPISTVSCCPRPNRFSPAERTLQQHAQKDHARRNQLKVGLRSARAARTCARCRGSPGRSGRRTPRCKLSPPRPFRSPSLCGPPIGFGTVSTAVRTQAEAELRLNFKARRSINRRRSLSRNLASSSPEKASVHRCVGGSLAGLGEHAGAEEPGEGRAGEGCAEHDERRDLHHLSAYMQRRRQRWEGSQTCIGSMATSRNDR